MSNKHERRVRAVKTQQTRRVVTAIIVVLLLAITFTGVYQIFPAGSSVQRVDDVTKVCTTDAATRYHIHPKLRLLIEGKEFPIPSGVGISPVCTRIIHTHDEKGVIHVESPVEREFLLGEFFQVWGRPFDRSQVFEHKVDATHELVMTVNGEPNAQYEELPLRDKDDIVIEYRAKR